MELSLGRKMTVTMFLGVILSLSFSSSVVGIHSLDFSNVASAGKLVNFSVPCDLHTNISIPDKGGLLLPVLLAVGYQEYQYDGKSWVLTNQDADLYNNTLSHVGTVVSKSHFASDAGTVTSQFITGSTVTVTPITSVPQEFSIPLQLLNVTGTTLSSPYSSASYVQRFRTIDGLPPVIDNTTVKGAKFMSGFTAFYPFYLPYKLSPQLATRVPRCGDERFYGLQYGQRAFT